MTSGVILPLLILGGALLVASIVLALVPRLRGEVLASQSLRRRARWLTAAFALVGLPFAIGAVRSLPIGGPPNPFGMMDFVILCAIVAAGWFVLPRVWAISRKARLAEQSEAGLHPNQLLAAASEPPGPHLGLSGQESAPTRW